MARGRAAGAVAVLGLASVRLFVAPRLDEPAAGDAIVVLDGDRPRRLRAALALLERVPASALVVVGGEAQAPGLFARRDPAYEALSVVPDPATTRGEARALALLARERGWRSLLVVTSTTHVTRARLIFRRALPDCELRFVSAGHSLRRLPRDVLTEWAKLCLALAVRRAP